MTHSDFPTTASHLNQKITSYAEEIASLTDCARISDAMRAYLDTLNRFHRYSMHNSLLICWAKPDATQVAGYHKWREFNRQVRKGEKGIAILVPMFIKCNKDEPQSETILRFQVGYVFDISQTDGEPLPETPDWKSREQNQQLADLLLAFAASQGIAVTVEALAGEKQGVSKGGAIVLSPDAGTKTLIHELAHELLHQKELKASREAMETEAESVAYVVARHFGLTDLNSPNYLALWNANSATIRDRMGRICECARQIISAIEPGSKGTAQ